MTNAETVVESRPVDAFEGRSIAESDAVGPRLAPAGTRVETLVEGDLLVEDISIDGMCGVY